MQLRKKENKIGKLWEYKKKLRSGRNKKRMDKKNMGLKGKKKRSALKNGFQGHRKVEKRGKKNS